MRLFRRFTHRHDPLFSGITSIAKQSAERGGPKSGTLGLVLAEKIPGNKKIANHYFDRLFYGLLIFQ